MFFQPQFIGRSPGQAVFYFHAGTFLSLPINRASVRRLHLVLFDPAILRRTLLRWSIQSPYIHHIKRDRTATSFTYLPVGIRLPLQSITIATATLIDHPPPSHAWLAPVWPQSAHRTAMEYYRFARIWAQLPISLRHCRTFQVESLSRGSFRNEAIPRPSSADRRLALSFTC